MEQLDLNQQNETNSEVNDEDVEVEIEEDVEVDIIFNNATTLSCMLCELMRVWHHKGTQMWDHFQNFCRLLYCKLSDGRRIFSGFRRAISRSILLLLFLIQMHCNMGTLTELTLKKAQKKNKSLHRSSTLT